MLHSIKQLYGATLGATDGDIGHVKDFYFDDQHWTVRYLVADTGSWLPGRQVLISPHAIGSLHLAGRVLRVNLTRKQIEASPSIALHKTVSRQYEDEYHRHFGWPFYWQGDALLGMSGVPLVEVPPNPAPNGTTVVGLPKPDHADTHLRSALAVSGYNLRTADETIGHVCDFMLDSQSWVIGKLVIKIGHRFTGKEVQIPMRQVDRISYEESAVFVSLTREAIEQSPAHDLTPVSAVD